MADKPKKILIVEDEQDLVKVLEYNLQKEGYLTAKAYDGEAGFALFQTFRPDLVILDLMMPKLNGMEVCRMIRKESGTLILMLTAKQEEVDRVLGLELGADDYVTKPFSLRELLARVKALFRRTQPSVPASSSFKNDLLEISFDRFEVKVRGEMCDLTSKEFELLRFLVGGQEKVFSREELLQQVWGVDKSAQMDTRTVDQHVARLRKKLGPAKKYLLTVKSRGYRFKGE